MSTTPKIPTTSPTTSPSPTPSPSAGTSTDRPDPIDELVVPITAKYHYDRGVALAARLAEHWGLPVRLLHVDTTPCEDDAVAVPVGGHIGEARARLKAQCPNIDVTDEVLTGGNIARVLSDALKPSSLVVMATDDAGGTARQTSHAEALAQHWRGPIALVGPNSSTVGPWSPVAVTVDGSAFAEQALPWARALAEDFGAPLTLIQVINADVSSKVAALRSTGEAVSESAYVRRVTDGFNADGLTAKWEIVHQDDSIDGILACIETSDIGLVVMTTHGATGVARSLYGSTCMGVVRSSTTPVIVIHPDVARPGELQP